MGHVAISAGYYLMAKLDMELCAEISASDLFDIDYIEVKQGVLQAGRLPRSRFFLWRDPKKEHDLIVFVGEAQPPLGKYKFCQRLLELGVEWGVERVFTFAAMATQMNPGDQARVFSAATSEKLLQAIESHGPEALEEGRIGGLNGVLLAAALEAGLEGICLLGEMPHIFAQLPFPKASLAVLQTFCEISNLTLDLDELEEQADAVSAQLGELLSEVEKKFSARQPGAEEEEEPEFGQFTEEPRLSPADNQRLETLFTQATSDRSKAFELKQELDRLGVFADYEDRFLDLFKKQ
jgi:proteasome assembly chaperone (PAC2) family protein